MDDGGLKIETPSGNDWLRFVRSHYTVADVAAEARSAVIENPHLERLLLVFPARPEITVDMAKVFHALQNKSEGLENYGVDTFSLAYALATYSTMDNLPDELREIRDIDRKFAKTTIIDTACYEKITIPSWIKDPKAIAWVASNVLLVESDYGTIKSVIVPGLSEEEQAEMVRVAFELRQTAEQDMDDTGSIHFRLVPDVTLTQTYNLVNMYALELHNRFRDDEITLDSAVEQLGKVLHSIAEQVVSDIWLIKANIEHLAKDDTLALVNIPYWITTAIAADSNNIEEMPLDADDTPITTLLKKMIAARINNADMDTFDGKFARTFIWNTVYLELASISGEKPITTARKIRTGKNEFTIDDRYRSLALAIMADWILNQSDPRHEIIGFGSLIKSLPRDILSRAGFSATARAFLNATVPGQDQSIRYRDYFAEVTTLSSSPKEA